jgi:uncharacterized protein YbjT (DUF2867 family)
MTSRKIFIAGATGAVGRTVVRLADEEKVDIVPHVRPKHEGADARAVRFELADADKLTLALRKCTTVFQLIGTMRKRFAAGDTYETSDIGTTRQLVDAAKAAGTIDHLVLLSSVGAGGMGAYLKAKATAEELVTGAGIGWTVFRPSFFVGEGHTAFPGAGLLGKLSARYRPIRVDELAKAILRVGRERAPTGVVLEGKSLFEVVGK